jgi:hypothetical protein
MTTYRRRRREKGEKGECWTCVSTCTCNEQQREFMKHIKCNCSKSCLFCKTEFKIYEKYKDDKDNVNRFDRSIERRATEIHKTARLLRRMQRKLEKLLDIKAVKANLPRVVVHGSVPLLPSCLEGIEELVLRAWKLQAEVGYLWERFRQIKRNYCDFINNN